MTFSSMFLFLSVIGLFSWLAITRRLDAIISTHKVVNSRPFYFKLWGLLWVLVPVVFVIIIGIVARAGVIDGWLIEYLPPKYQTSSSEELQLLLAAIKNGIKGTQIQAYLTPDLRPAAIQLIHFRTVYDQLLFAGSSLVALILLSITLYRVKRSLPARQYVEGWVQAMLMISASLAVLTTIGIILTLLFEAIRFFQLVSPFEFLFGTHWSPQISITASASTLGTFGAVPLFTGTLLIAVIALLVALPIGLYTAIYLSEYASYSSRAIIKPILEVLAGIPTIVYGFFAALTVAPSISYASNWLSSKLIGLGIIDTAFDVSSESALAAGLVIGVMLIPFISSMADDVFRAVPTSLRDGSLGLGATQRETVMNVVFPAALPGVVGGVMLAISRAIGETMIVVMAAGLAAKLTANPFESVTTVTTQIVTLLIGDQEFNSAKTLSAYALGLLLFIVTLILNALALHIVRKYREQYD